MEKYHPFFTEHFIQKDIVLLLCSLIGNEKYVINFLSCCKCLAKFKKLLVYKTPVTSTKINCLDYYDQFTDITVSNKFIKTKIIPGNKQFPKNLTHLTIEFRGKLKNILPYFSGLTHLKLLNNTEIKSMDFKLPETLVHLTWDIRQKLCINILPTNLRELVINCRNYINKLPDHIKSLTICGFNGMECHQKNMIALPQKLIKLSMISYGYRYCYDIPNTITDLEVINCHTNNYINDLSLEFFKNLINFRIDAETFYLNSQRFDDWNNLPKTLKTLTIFDATKSKHYFGKFSNCTTMSPIYKKTFSCYINFISTYVFKKLQEKNIKIIIED